MIIPFLVILVCAGLIAGDGDSESGSSAAAATSASDVGKVKPRVQVAKAPAPTELEVSDLVEGAGAEAKAGDEVTVHYVLLLQKNGKEVDTSWGGKPFSFELGAGQVTDGWEQGIEGMREGGRRELTTPSDLAYGNAGVPPAVGPNEALVSVIDLLKVKEPAPDRGQGQGQSP